MYHNESDCNITTNNDVKDAHLVTSFPFKLQHDHLSSRATDDQRLTQSTQVELVNGQARVVTEWVIHSHLHTDR